MKLLNQFMICSLFVGLVSGSAHGLTLALASNSGAEIMIDSAPELGKLAHLLKFSGIKSKWADKVMQVKIEQGRTSERYFFDYTLDLSSGKQPRTYYILVENGKTLIGGSLVRKFELYLPEGNNKAYEFYESPELAKKEKATDLAKIYKKSPFMPEVD